MSEGVPWYHRPSDRLDEYDAARARSEAGLMPTLADAMRERCPACRGDLSLAQYGTAGRDWCHRCEPEKALPATPCACGAVAEVWFYDLAEPLGCCARCAAPHLARMAAR